MQDARNVCSGHTVALIHEARPQAQFPVNWAWMRPERWVAARIDRLRARIGPCVVLHRAASAQARAGCKNTALRLLAPDVQAAGKEVRVSI